MAKCTSCGAELFETSKFCPECGTPVVQSKAEPTTDENTLNEAIVTETDETPVTESVEKEADEAPTTEADVKEENEAPATDADVKEENETPATESDEKKADEISVESTVAETIEAAEKALADIPDIKKLDDVAAPTSEPAKEEIKEEPKPAVTEKKSVEQTEKKPDDFSDMGAYVPPAKEVTEEEEKTVVPEPEKKKSKGGIIAAVIVILALAAVGGYFFLTSSNNPQPNVTQLTETVVTTEITDPALGSSDESIEVTVTESVSSAVEAVAETSVQSTVSSAVSESADTTAPTETVSESSAVNSDAVTDTAISETTSVSISLTEMPESDIVIEPEHTIAMGTSISAEISLSASAVPDTVLIDSTLFIAEFSTTAATLNSNPVIMVLHLNGTDVDVIPSSVSDGFTVFEYSLMKSAAEEAGFTVSDIDSIGFRSTGAPVDVFKITITQG